MKRRVCVFVLTCGLLASRLLAGEVVFPHVASGPHYITELKITNLDNQAATVSLSFFTPKGQATDAFVDSSSSSLVIPVRSTTLVQLKRGPGDVAGWARARSAATLSGVLHISYLPATGLTSSSSFDHLQLLSTARIEGAANDTERQTAIAICNPGAEALDLELELFDARGKSLGRVTWSVAASQQRALFLEELGMPGAHSVEILSRSGLFGAISVSQNATQMVANAVNELSEKRFAMQQESFNLGFTAYRLKTRGGLAVVTGSNGVNIIDLNRKAVIGTVPLILDEFIWAGIAFHPSRPLVAVAGRLETIVIDLNTLAVLKRFPLERAAVAFDNLTETFVTGERRSAGLTDVTRFTSYDPDFQPIASQTFTGGPGRPEARNGILVTAVGSVGFIVLRLPPLKCSH